MIDIVAPMRRKRAAICPFTAVVDENRFRFKNFEFVVYNIQNTNEFGDSFLKPYVKKALLKINNQSVTDPGPPLIIVLISANEIVTDDFSIDKIRNMKIRRADLSIFSSSNFKG